MIRNFPNTTKQQVYKNLRPGGTSLRLVGLKLEGPKAQQSGGDPEIEILTP